MPRPAFLAAVLACVLAAPLAAQAPAGATLTGTVRAADGETLVGASVYLSGTQRGAATDRNGRFRIEGVPPGAYRLVASFIGHRAGVRDVRVGTADAGPFDFVLEPVAVEGAAVTVEAEGDARWRRRYERFRRVLLGESENAAQTEIENPWVLDFRDRFGALTASARAPLVIVNRALGYRLHYDLRAFEATDTRVRYDGEERFEEMEPADAAEAARWATARALAYRGSLRHLLQALGDGRAEADGFVFSTRRLTADGQTLAEYVGRPIAEADLVARVDSAETGAPGWYRFRAPDVVLGVTYTREPEVPAYLRSEWFREGRSAVRDRQESGLRIDNRTGVLVDPRSNPEDPFGISVMGYLAFERLADLVPAEYVPPAATPASEIQRRRPPAGTRGGR